MGTVKTRIRRKRRRPLKTRSQIKLKLSRIIVKTVSMKTKLTPTIPQTPKSPLTKNLKNTVLNKSKNMKRLLKNRNKKSQK